ncbi:MAG TPA: GerMN domain-containing protein [Clostridia bacterium]|nr:GerMN domain-containing protein [Clostridia bacterium]
MKKALRVATAFAVIIMLCMCAAACAKTGEVVEDPAEAASTGGTGGYTGFRQTILYYLSDDGFVVPVMRNIPWEEGIGKAALSYLVDTADNRASTGEMGLNALIPDGTTYTLRIGDDGVAVVDLIGLSACKDAATEKAMVEAIVNTLAEFTRIDSVTITVNGKKVSELPNGTELSEAMAPFSLNAEDGEVGVSTEGASALTLFFPNATGSLNVPVTRYIVGGANVENAVNELIKGPQAEGLLCCFPEGTELLSVTIEEGVATVDLSGEFLSAQYTDGLIEAAYDTLFLTINNLEAISRLDLMVDGEPCELAAETSAPLFINEFR